MNRTKELFSILADVWEENTRFESFPHMWVKHPEYDELIHLLEADTFQAVALICDRLRKHPALYVYLLNVVTGEDHGGKTDLIQKAAGNWLDWAWQTGRLGSGWINPGELFIGPLHLVCIQHPFESRCPWCRGIRYYGVQKTEEFDAQFKFKSEPHPWSSERRPWAPSSAEIEAIREEMELAQDAMDDSAILDS